VRTKTYTENDVVEALRDGRRLMLMHTGGGKEWYVAHAVIRREDVHGTHDDQWPRVGQVFKYRRVA